MKALMYHYVREGSPSLPHFRYLHVEDFRLQLDEIGRSDHFVSRQEFLSALAGGAVARDGVLLTFDDGFADHVEYVLPELQARGLWGIFYIPTAIYQRRELLDVHRIHVLLGSLGGAEMLKRLRALVSTDMLDDAEVERFCDTTYRNQQSDESTTAFKRILNYYLEPGFKRKILNEMMCTCFDDESELASRFYLSAEQTRRLHDAGMLVGSHGIRHDVMSRLDLEDQHSEIRDSFAALERIVGALQPRTFCYPYGGRSTYSSDTERLLVEADCAFAFTVDARPIDDAGIREHPCALPRYDCSQFPHGVAAYGSRRPDVDSARGKLRSVSSAR